MADGFCGYPAQATYTPNTQVIPNTTFSIIGERIRLSHHQSKVRVLCGETAELEALTTIQPRYCHSSVVFRHKEE